MMIDPKILANQRETLQDVIRHGVLTPAQRADLEGVMTTLDRLKDMVLVLGPNKVACLNGDSYYDGDGVRIGPSTWSPGPNWSQLVDGVISSADDTGCDGVTVVDQIALTKLKNAMEVTS